jgi:FkbM family methyltransferase
MKDNNLRDVLRNQEKIIEELISDLSKNEKEFELFNFIVKNSGMSCSRNFSDLVALFYLGKNKSYLEIGAGEPIIGSDTFLLEQKMLWTGIQVEPDLRSFNKLQTTRTSSIQINAAVVGDEDKSSYFLDPDKMSLSKKKKNFLQVQTISLEYIKHKHGTNFDALFIDVEGGELSIITSKLFMDFNFKYINIERIWNHQKIIEVLTNYGYNQIGASFSSYSAWFIK